MSKLGDAFVRFCSSLHSIPAALLCILLFTAQCASMDYYLVHVMGNPYLFWLAVDFISVSIFTVCIYMANRSLEHQHTHETSEVASVAWVAWLFSGIALSIKVIIINYNVSHHVEEKDGNSFFGANTLKTTIAMGSIIYLLLLTTQHDAPIGSERRRYIDELTGTVVFDLLDTADVLEILFDEETKEELWASLEEFILAVATFNLLVPAMPLFTLSKTKFGKQKLTKGMVYMHRILIVLMVNVPNMLVRMLLWHGFSVGVTPFFLKNIILIGITLYEFYEHKLQKYEFHEHEKKIEENGNHGDSNQGNQSQMQNGDINTGKNDGEKNEDEIDIETMATFTTMERNMITSL